MKKALQDKALAPYLTVGTTTMKERRKDFRRPEENKVILKYVPPEAAPEGGRLLTGVATNTSAGGMKIVIGEAIPPDALVNVEFSLPEKEKPMDLKGRVKWIWTLEEGKTYEVGLEFIDPPTESLLDLLEYTYKK